MNTGRRTSHSFNLVLEDCYSKLSQAASDLEHHTAHVTAEIDRLKAHIRHLKQTIPREDEQSDRRQLMYRRYTLQVDYVKQSIWFMSTKIADLSTGLHWNEVSVQRAVNRVLSRIAGEMPTWIRNGS